MGSENGARKRQAIRDWWLVLRDIFAFFGGLGILSWETMVESADRPWLIAAALGMMGFPFAVAVDKWLKTGGGKGPKNGSEDSGE